MAASIVAVGVSANLWRFLWGPVAAAIYFASDARIVSTESIGERMRILGP